jgi:hypothetical protein
MRDCRVAQSKTGLGVFASQDVDAGALVLTDEPLCVASSSGLSAATFEAMSNEALEQLWALAGGDTLIQKARANGVALGDGRGGVFALFSRLNHSCDANCAFAFDGVAMRVTTVRAVAAGEELTINYRPNDLAVSPLQRHVQLLRSFEFICQCRLCEKGQ